jgi:hypothetical protein
MTIELLINNKSLRLCIILILIGIFVNFYFMYSKRVATSKLLKLSQKNKEQKIA